MSSDRRCSVALLLALVAGAACADFSRGPAPAAPDAAVPDGAAGGEGGTVSYAVAVHPIMVAVCKQCHAPGGQAGDTPLLLDGDAADDYAVTIPYVDTTAPGSSRILNLISGHGHGGGTVFAETTPEYATFLRWIEGGALP